MTTTETFSGAWQRWHEARENTLASEHGWLSITRLEWLDTEPRRFEGIPGSWHQDGVAAYVSVEPGEDLDVDGSARFELGATAAGALLVSGDQRIEVAHRGEGYILRVHDSAAPTRTAFRGVPAYPADPDWVIQARYVPFDEARPVTVGAVAEGLQHVYTSPGTVRFTHEGAEHELTAFNGTNGGLSILFTDSTSGKTTYGANRSLATSAPQDGTVALDFNRAVNLPCAFIDLATCPLPPEGNHLPFAVTAGEKIPYERAR